MDVLNLRETVLALAGVDAVVYSSTGSGMRTSVTPIARRPRTSAMPSTTRVSDASSTSPA